MAHETSHQFGLPDLYAFDPTTSQSEYAGVWDVMSFHTTGAHYTAWQKQKLGWLLSDEMVCIAGGGLEASLQPIESAGGLKSIALRVSPTRAIVAEVRRHIGRAAEDAAAGLTIDVVAEETPSFRIRIKKRS